MKCGIAVFDKMAISATAVATYGFNASNNDRSNTNLINHSCDL
jgi:hypothetical protein